MTRSANAAGSSQVGTGIILMLLSVILSPLIDIFSKLAVETVSAGQITAGRFVVQAACMLPFVVARRRHLTLFTRQTFYHAIRGGLIAISMISFVTTLKYMAVADAIAIFFVEPIFLTILSSIFLKETIGWRRYTACAIGFGGALLIIQPSFQEVGAVAILPVITALVIAIYAMMTRALSKREDPWIMQFQTAIWGLAIVVVMLFMARDSGNDILTTIMPEGKSLLYMAGVGAMAALAGILGVYAYRAAPAATLAPLQYFEIVSATAVAWWVFGDFPDALKWAGIAIIMASGFYIIWRERRLNSRPVSDVPQASAAP